MSDESTPESLIVSDLKKFNEFFDKNYSTLSALAKESGLDQKLREVMRHSWRKCCDVKNAEAMVHIEKISQLEKEISAQLKKYDELHLELQRVTNKLISAEKNAKK